MSVLMPKPWRLAGPHDDGSNTIVAADGRIVCALMPHEAKNGESVVLAVNAYDDMLAALEYIAAPQYGVSSGTAWDQLVDVRKTARKMLAKHARE